MEHKKFNIIIKYKLDGEDEWKIIDITPEEYFDLDENELIEIDCVPMHNHAIDYIKDCPERITSTKIIISDDNNKKKRIITTTYWNSQQNWINERMDFDKSITKRMDFDNDCSYYALIIHKQIQDNPSVYEIIRVIKENDVLVPIYHGFITDMEDGSQVENLIVYVLPPS